MIRFRLIFGSFVFSLMSFQVLGKKKSFCLFNHFNDASQISFFRLKIKISSESKQNHFGSFQSFFVHFRRQAPVVKKIRTWKTAWRSEAPDGRRTTGSRRTLAPSTTTSTSIRTSTATTSKAASPSTSQPMSVETFSSSTSST